jgi:threonylcarbamoyladenosine tRNA methylthiotransferase MtaB
MDECIDIAIGNNKKNQVVSILKKYLENNVNSLDQNDTDIVVSKKHKDVSMEMDPSIKVGSKEKTEYEEMKLEHAPEHTRAYIKIQDGCNQFCTYCVIPYARGRVRSRDMGDVIKEVKDLSLKGCKEVVITGIHVGSYGIDKGRPMLVDLVEKVAQIEGIERIRLGSIEPRFITKENVERMARIDKLCPHFHLSLQSGCNSVLKRMNRHYTAEEFKESVAFLRKAFDRPAITTDVIVGFPGETKEEFEECRDFVSDIEFYEMHVFKYSPRKGTVAAGMADQLTDRQKSERSDVLLDITARDSEEYRKGFVGQELSVLWEDEEVHGGKKYMIGHTDRYVRVAACEGSSDYKNAISGEFSRVTPRTLLNADTLLI